MLAYGCAFERRPDSRVREYCLKKLEECAHYTERRCTFTEAEHSQVHGDLFVRIPRFFRWLVLFHLASMPSPRDVADSDALASPPLGTRHFALKNIRNTFLPIPNYRPPMIAQMDLIVHLEGDRQTLPNPHAHPPRRIETQEQEDFVGKYCSAIWKRRAIPPILVLELPPCPLQVKGALPVDADLFFLVDLHFTGRN
ncbi:hypothetical protein BV20DRAFT_1036101 [Pilatotrama ljubarskyi]|nr:hypothetical protein BV20DRAFT_1036101 [Pilatotrama ljubarskyi]